MLHWLKRSRDEISRAAPGKLRVWVDIDDNTVKIKDEFAVVRTLGNGIKSIAMTGSTGLADTYTITRDDNAETTFSVTNGRGIASIEAPAAAGQPNTTDTYTVNYNDGSTSQFVVRNGRDGIDGQDGLVLSVNGISAAAVVLDTDDIAEGAANLYHTTARAAAAAPVQSVNGQTGAVTVAAGTNNMAVSNTARGAAFSTAVTTVASLPITGGTVQAGDTYFVRVRAQVTNTTATSNLVATLAVGATAVATLTQALGGTSRTNQPVLLEGSVTFLSATSAEATVRAFASAAVAFDALAGSAASVAVSTAANTDVNVKLNTSATTSTLTVAQVLIYKEK